MLNPRSTRMHTIGGATSDGGIAAAMPSNRLVWRAAVSDATALHSNALHPAVCLRLAPRCIAFSGATMTATRISLEAFAGAIPFMDRHGLADEVGVEWRQGT